MRRMSVAVITAVGLAAIASTTPWAPARAQSDAELRDLVTRHVQPLLLAPAGMAVALHIDGRTVFFNFGMADSARKQAMTSDALFNLASVGKVFTSTLLAQAVKRGEVALDDPVAKYVTELQQGGDIRKVTLGQLASHTSGLHRVPRQYEPWHRGPYSLPDFIRYLNAWKADDGHEPGKQDIYSNTGFVLLALALQRRFDTPYAKLLEQRLLAPLGMTSTAMPVPRPNARGQIAPALRSARCRATPSTAIRSASPATSRASSTGPAPGRCIPPPATWRCSSPPISARCPTIVRRKTRWRSRSRAYSRSIRASPRRSAGRSCATTISPSSTRTAASTTPRPMSG